MTEITDPHFDFRSVTGIEGTKLRLEHEFRALRNHVAAEDYDSYRENISKVRDNLFHHIRKPITGDDAATTTPANGNSRFAQLLLSFAGILGLLPGVGLCALLSFWDPPAREPTTREYVGPGGWLILPVIGVFLAPIIILIDGSSFFVNLADMGSHRDAQHEEALWVVPGPA